MRKWLARRLRRLAYRLDPWSDFNRTRIGASESTATSGGTVTYKTRED